MSQALPTSTILGDPLLDPLLIAISRRKYCVSPVQTHPGQALRVNEIDRGFVRANNQGHCINNKVCMIRYSRLTLTIDPSNDQ